MSETKYAKCPFCGFDFVFVEPPPLDQSEPFSDATRWSAALRCEPSTHGQRTRTHETRIEISR